MKSKFFKLYLFLFLLTFSIVPINAQSKIKLWINNSYVETDTPPQIHNDRTYVPVRIISEKLGYNVDWVKENNEIKISNPNISLILKINSNDYTINNQNKKSDVFPIIINNRTMVPVRLIAESFNQKVVWDDKNKTVAIGNDYNNTIYEMAVVTRVIDGDTIEVKINEDKKTVRLIGVNTPETKHPKKGAEYYGKEASNFTNLQLNKKTIYLQKDVSDTDKYGRLLRFVWLSRPNDIIPTENEIEKYMFNAILVKNGYANVSTYAPNISYKDNFIKLENIAKEKNLGLWQNKNASSKHSNTDLNIKTGKIKGNKKSKVYHLENQKDYNKVNSENIIYFNTEQEAINAGYRKAKR